MNKINFEFYVLNGRIGLYMNYRSIKLSSKKNRHVRLLGKLSACLVRLDPFPCLAIFIPPFYLPVPE